MLATLAAFALTGLAILAAAGPQEEPREVPAADFAHAFDELDGYVTRLLASRGRAEEADELAAAFRKQLEAGLIDRETYEEAVRELSPGPLEYRGRPFTGVVVDGDPRGADRIEATFEEGELRRAVFWTSDAARSREIVVDEDAVRETIFWPAAVGNTERTVVVYEDQYMGDATTRTFTPDGELIVSTTPEGRRPGPGWIGDVDMWDPENRFYRSVEACEPVKLFVQGAYFEVLGPRDDGCGVEKGYWDVGRAGARQWIGKSVVCVFRAERDDAYDFVAALHGATLPTTECEGGLAALWEEGG